jgi:molybdopterin-guanine dinucleotide biosynthesis protein
VARGEKGFEPLAAVYCRGCVPLMKERIKRGRLKLIDIFSEVRTRIVNTEDISAIDPLGMTFKNVNSTAELDDCRFYLARLRSFGPPAFSFVAKSGTGKTTLLIKVIEELTRRGFSVGAVKHDAHNFEIDHEGKDSWRITKAGASPMIISSKEKLAMVEKDYRGEMPLADIIYSFMGNVDLVITEGYKMGNLPKIEVHRKEHSDELLCMTREGELKDHRLIAVVSDEDLNLPVPGFDLNQPGPLCDFIEERFLNGV